MRKIKRFSLSQGCKLSNEEMSYISGGLGDRYHTSCTMEIIGEKCITDAGKCGVCDYTATYSSNGNVLYYDTYCKV